MTGDVAIAASYEMLPGRYPDISPHEMYRTLVTNALVEWKLKPGLIDGLICTPSGVTSGHPDVIPHERLVGEFGLRATFAETLSAGGASFSIMVIRAAAAIRDGLAQAVLCLGAGKFVKQSSGGGETIARLSSEPDYEVPYGPSIPSLYGLIASQFMHERNARAEDLARVAVSARRWALRNPRALMHKRGEITIEDVLSSRMIADPFHYLDCSVPTDGGGAILVTSAELARRITDQPAYLLGYGEMHPHSSVSDAGTRLIDSGAIASGADAFRRAGIGHADIDLVQLYDAFSMTPLLLLENLGFCKPGAAASFVQSGATDPGGSLPMNTGGGLLSFGHTGEASGMSVLIEGVRQVMGTAGSNQVERAQTALVHTYGGLMCDHATLILGRSA